MNKKQHKEYKRLLDLLFATKEHRKNGNWAINEFSDDCLKLAGKLKEESSVSVHHKAMLLVSDPDLILVDELLRDITDFLPVMKLYHDAAMELYGRFDILMKDFLTYKDEVTASTATNLSIKDSTEKMEKIINAIREEIMIINDGLAPIAAKFAVFKNKYNCSNN